MPLYPIEKREVLWKDEYSDDKKEEKAKKLKKTEVFEMGKERKSNKKK